MDRIFIAAAPRQDVAPKPGVVSLPYEPVNNERLGFEESLNYPVINIMHGYVEKDDKVKVLVITADYDFCKRNFKLIKEAAEAVCKEAGASECLVKEIAVEFSEESENHLKIFESLVEEIHDGDRLSACITYGSKPTPLLEIMALNYGYRTCKNVAIDCIAYGEMDHATRVKRIYDVTSLFLMDQIVNELSKKGNKNTLSIIQGLLAEE